MSADDGYIIRQNTEGKFVLQHYFASADDFPPLENAREEEKFDTLEEAVRKFAELEQTLFYPSEYGLRVQL